MRGINNRLKTIQRRLVPDDNRDFLALHFTTDNSRHAKVSGRLRSGARVHDTLKSESDFADFLRVDGSHPVTFEGVITVDSAGIPVIKGSVFDKVANADKVGNVHIRRMLDEYLEDVTEDDSELMRNADAAFKDLIETIEHKRKR